MAVLWNLSEELRESKTVAGAKRAAHKLASKLLRDGLTVSTPASKAGELGSIPGRGKKTLSLFHSSMISFTLSLFRDLFHEPASRYMAAATEQTYCVVPLKTGAYKRCSSGHG